jgi:hypothetical protein
LTPSSSENANTAGASRSGVASRSWEADGSIG